MGPRWSRSVLSGSLAFLARDERLPQLVDLAARLPESLGRVVPSELLDAPASEYRIDNFRYRPGEKIVISLLSPVAQRPVAVRVFPLGLAHRQLRNARSDGQGNTFLLEDLGAVAWVFPSEKKLDLGNVADSQRLARMLHESRGLALRGSMLAHYVPEHTYTLKLEASDVNGCAVVEYLKVYSDDTGRRAAAFARELGPQLESDLAVATDITYLSSCKVLLQRALPRDTTRRLGDTAAANSLAKFHHLSSKAAPYVPNSTAERLDLTVSLIRAVFPECRAAVEELSRAILGANRKLSPTPPVLIHGDAHLGNLLPLTDGRVGFIDLDSIGWGKAEQDICSYFGFKLWLELRAGNAPDALLSSFPLFVEKYNHTAKIPLRLSRAYLQLALAMVVERISRGIARGKLESVADIEQFVALAWHCFDCYEAENV